MSPINMFQQQQPLLQYQFQRSITVLEEPMSRVRFRYATEGDKAGNIYGISNTTLHQTFPAVLVSSRRTGLLLYNRSRRYLELNDIRQKSGLNFCMFHI